MNKYNQQFYADRHETTIKAAETILSAVQAAIPPVHSAVDIGCGVGSWLSVLQARGLQEILGIDGDWVDQAQLIIDPKFFMRHDLNKELKLPRRYDLVICLEVAEHLSASGAQAFVQSLTALSDFVLFSAAVPGQGGTGHVNEQWQDYWLDIFRQQGYVALDFIRKNIWNDPSIPIWYKQNMFLFVKAGRSAEVVCAGNTAELPVRVVHPDLYIRRVIRPTFFQALKILARSIKKIFTR